MSVRAEIVRADTLFVWREFCERPDPLSSPDRPSNRP